jgi:hypothetical protein
MFAFTHAHMRLVMTLRMANTPSIFVSAIFGSVEVFLGVVIDVPLKQRLATFLA